MIHWLTEYFVNGVGTYMAYWSAGGFYGSQIVEYANARMTLWALSKVD